MIYYTTSSSEGKKILSVVLTSFYLNECDNVLLLHLFQSNVYLHLTSQQYYTIKRKKKDISESTVGGVCTGAWNLTVLKPWLAVFLDTTDSPL